MPTALLVLALTIPGLTQQSSGIQYVYDALGRLVQVIDQEGNVAEYVYDAVGNLLEIRRSTLTGLAILGFTPPQGPVGITVTIQGQGFSSTPSENVVAFSGTVAPVLSASSTSLQVTVPPGATTGRITVTVGGATATSARDFSVLPGITAINPTVAVAGLPLPNLRVQGSNLTGSTFTFLPAFVPPAVTVTSDTIDPSGASATLNLTVDASATGTLVLIATNAAGSSSTLPAAANTLRILNSNEDTDFDGLSNSQELAAGTDPLNGDTDGDKVGDGEEVGAGSNPLDATSLPFNPNQSVGEAGGRTFAVLNTTPPPEANFPREAVGLVFSLENVTPP